MRSKSHALPRPMQLPVTGMLHRKSLMQKRVWEAMQVSESGRMGGSAANSLQVYPGMNAAWFGRKVYQCEFDKQNHLTV